jgi:hypothetical protein
MTFKTLNYHNLEFLIKTLSKNFANAHKMYNNRSCKALWLIKCCLRQERADSIFLFLL